MNRTICKKKAKANDQKKYNIRKSYKIYQRTLKTLINILKTLRSYDILKMTILCYEK